MRNYDGLDPEEFEERLHLVRDGDEPVRGIDAAVGFVARDADGSRGPWIQTRSGRKFHFLDPRPEDMIVGDVSAALSKTCRFSGHCVQFLSVAEHSVLVLMEARLRGYLRTPRDARTALLHDASEGYVTDLSRPLKRELARYVEIEAGLMACAAERFDFEWPLPKWVKEVDDAVGFREATDNMADPSAYVTWAPAPSAVRPLYWSHQTADRQFLRAAEAYEVRDE